MTKFLMRGGPALALFAGLALLAGGCGQAANTGGETKAPGKGAEVAKADGNTPVGTQPAGKKAEGEKGAEEDKHDGWWCDEHALPEEVCDLCRKKYRAAEKAKGNWCEHGRVKSSCFKCNPGLKEKYAADYKAKYGKAPPAEEANEPKDDGKAKDKK